MAAYEGIASVTAGTWTEITDSDVTANISFQIHSASREVYVKPTTNTTAPTTRDGAFRYQQGQGELNLALADMCPGETTPVRMFAYSDEPAKISVSHD